MNEINVLFPKHCGCDFEITGNDDLNDRTEDSKILQICKHNLENLVHDFDNILLEWGVSPATNDTPSRGCF